MVISLTWQVFFEFKAFKTYLDSTSNLFCFDVCSLSFKNVLKLSPLNGFSRKIRREFHFSLKPFLVFGLHI
jgi:hypothetical protein